jgi:transposase
MPKIYSYELKLSVMNFYHSKYWKIKDAVYILNVSKSTIYNWIDLYKNNMLTQTTNIRTSYNR